MRVRKLLWLALLLQVSAAAYAFFLRSSSSSAEPEKPIKVAYATLLCNDLMEDAAAVLVFSLKQTGSPHDIVVLSMPGVSDDVIARLQALGARIHTVTRPVEYPWPVTQARAAIAKPCRYSKLRLWSLTEFHRIVYLDADMLVLKNLDHLFSLPELTAVADSLPPDRFNSGLMVLQPNQSTFEDMITKVHLLPSPNVGDQGFLNEYFSDWYTKGGKLHYGYNALVRVSQFSTWDAWVEPKLMVLHFSGLSKPWNVVQDPKQPSTRRYDHVWWDAYRKMLQWEAANTTRRPAFSRPQVQHTPICLGDFMAYNRDGTADVERLSLLLYFNAGGGVALEHLKQALRHYDRMNFVAKIFLVWGSPKVVPDDPEALGLRTPIDVRYSGRSSLNDKFRPIATLATACVLVVDSNVKISKAALLAALEAWKKESYRLLGFSAAAYSRAANTGNLLYEKPGRKYSIVTSSTGLLMHSDYLRAYTCHAPQVMVACRVIGKEICRCCCY